MKCMQRFGRSLFLLMGLNVLFLGLYLAKGQERGEATRLRYPHVNLATWYEVDPDWPQKPSEYKWGEMPGVAVDKEDHAWIFTRSNPPVQVFDANGKLIRAWGENTIKRAHHIRIDQAGNVWLSDVGSHVVRKYTPEGKVLLTLGTPDQPGVDETHLNQPTDMAVTPRGDVFVSDGYGNNRVVHFDRTGKFVKAWGKLGTGQGEFSLPHSIVVDSKGRLYVADRNNVRVQVFSASGKFLQEWRDIAVPWGLWVTNTDEIWVCGSSPMFWKENEVMVGMPPRDQVFMKFNTAGKLLQLWTVPKGADGQEKPGELNWVHAIAVDSKGAIYAGDIKGQRAQKFLPRK